MLQLHDKLCLLSLINFRLSYIVLFVEWETKLNAERSASMQNLNKKNMKRLRLL